MDDPEPPAIVAVKDACALIDLVNGGVLAHWFRLGIRTITSDFVLREIRDGPQWSAVKPHVDASNLEVMTLNGDELLEMQASLGHLRISPADRSVLFLAKRESAIVVSGDGKVRSDGRTEGLEIRGVLWILDLLVERTVLDGPEAAAALAAMIDGGTYLPDDLVAERLRIWRP